MYLLNYEEAAEFLRCTANTLRKKKMLGQVPYVKPFGKNGRVFFIREDLEELILKSGNREKILAATGAR